MKSLKSKHSSSPIDEIKILFADVEKKSLEKEVSANEIATVITKIIEYCFDANTKSIKPNSDMIDQYLIKALQWGIDHQYESDLANILNLEELLSAKVAAQIETAKQGRETLDSNKISLAVKSTILLSTLIKAIYNTNPLTKESLQPFYSHLIERVSQNLSIDFLKYNCMLAVLATSEYFEDVSLYLAITEQLSKYDHLNSFIFDNLILEITLTAYKIFSNIPICQSQTQTILNLYIKSRDEQNITNSTINAQIAAISFLGMQAINKNLGFDEIHNKFEILQNKINWNDDDSKITPSSAVLTKFINLYIFILIDEKLELSTKLSIAINILEKNQNLLLIIAPIVINKLFINIANTLKNKIFEANGSKDYKSLEYYCSTIIHLLSALKYNNKLVIKFHGAYDFKEIKFLTKNLIFILAIDSSEKSLSISLNLLKNLTNLLIIENNFSGETVFHQLLLNLSNYLETQEKNNENLQKKLLVLMSSGILNIQTGKPNEAQNNFTEFLTIYQESNEKSQSILTDDIFLYLFEKIKAIHYKNINQDIADNVYLFSAQIFFNKFNFVTFNKYLKLYIEDASKKIQSSQLNKYIKLQNYILDKLKNKIKITLSDILQAINTEAVASLKTNNFDDFKKNLSHYFAIVESIKDFLNRDNSSLYEKNKFIFYQDILSISPSITNNEFKNHLIIFSAIRISKDIEDDCFLVSSDSLNFILNFLESNYIDIINYPLINSLLCFIGHLYDEQNHFSVLSQRPTDLQNIVKYLNYSLNIASLSKTNITVKQLILKDQTKIKSLLTTFDEHLKKHTIKNKEKSININESNNNQSKNETKTKKNKTEDNTSKYSNKTIQSKKSKKKSKKPLHDSKISENTQIITTSFEEKKPEHNGIEWHSNPIITSTIENQNEDQLSNFKEIENNKATNDNESHVESFDITDIDSKNLPSQQSNAFTTESHADENSENRKKLENLTNTISDGTDNSNIEPKSSNIELNQNSLIPSNTHNEKLYQSSKGSMEFEENTLNSHKILPNTPNEASNYIANENADLNIPLNPDLLYKSQPSEVKNLIEFILSHYPERFMAFHGGVTRGIPDDYDLISNIPLQEVFNLLKTGGYTDIKVVSKENPIITLYVNNYKIDIGAVTRNMDNGDYLQVFLTDGQIAYYYPGTLEQDALRGDLKVNKLYLVISASNTTPIQFHKKFVDHCGALSDLKNKLLTIPGDAETRIKQYPDLIFRELYLYVKLYDFKINDEQIIRKNISYITNFKNHLYLFSLLSKFFKKIPGRLDFSYDLLMDYKILPIILYNNINFNQHNNYRYLKKSLQKYSLLPNKERNDIALFITIILFNPFCTYKNYQQNLDTLVETRLNFQNQLTFIPDIIKNQIKIILNCYYSAFNYYYLDPQMVYYFPDDISNDQITDLAVQAAYLCKTFSIKGNIDDLIDTFKLNLNQLLAFKFNLNQFNSYTNYQNFPNQPYHQSTDSNQFWKKEGKHSSEQNLPTQSDQSFYTQHKSKTNYPHRNNSKNLTAIQRHSEEFWLPSNQKCDTKNPLPNPTQNDTFNSENNKK